MYKTRGREQREEFQKVYYVVAKIGAAGHTPAHRRSRKTPQEDSHSALPQPWPGGHDRRQARSAPGGHRRDSWRDSLRAYAPTALRDPANPIGVRPTESVSVAIAGACGWSKRWRGVPERATGWGDFMANTLAVKRGPLVLSVHRICPMVDRGRVPSGRESDLVASRIWYRPVGTTPSSFVW